MMYKLRNKQLNYFTKGKYHDGGELYIRVTCQGKDYVTDKSESKIFKYSELGNF